MLLRTRRPRRARFQKILSSHVFSYYLVFFFRIFASDFAPSQRWSHCGGWRRPVSIWHHAPLVLGNPTSHPVAHVFAAGVCVCVCAAAANRVVRRRYKRRSVRGATRQLGDRVHVGRTFASFVAVSHVPPARFVCVCAYGERRRCLARGKSPPSERCEIQHRLLSLFTVDFPFAAIPPQ